MDRHGRVYPGHPRLCAHSRKDVDARDKRGHDEGGLAVSKPRAACLIGWPAAHSRSPLIHHYWLRTLGIEGGYVIEAVPPDEFADFVMRLSIRGFVGANVTIPHKERALALSKPDARARAVGAANTLWYQDGELCSTNTDVEGFINNLDASAPGWDKAPDALVLGAGGAARAVVAALIEARVEEISIANRTPVRAERLADDLAAPVTRMTIHAWDERNAALRDAGILINTTSLGMAGEPALDLDLSQLPLAAVVVDIVYVPLETALLANARRRGHRVVDGLGMLLHQGRPGFEAWFGSPVQVTRGLRAAVLTTLTAPR
jgi:shikimate dehydrogenase